MTLSDPKHPKPPNFLYFHIFVTGGDRDFKFVGRLNVAGFSP